MLNVILGKLNCILIKDVIKIHESLKFLISLLAEISLANVFIYQSQSILGDIPITEIQEVTS